MAAGLIPLALTVPGLLAFVQGLENRTATVSLAPREAVGPPLALLAFALAALTLTPPLPRRKGTASRWVTACLAVAFAAVFLTVLAVTATEWGAAITMSNRGYIRCPAPAAERRAHVRWALSPDHCP